MASAPEKFHLRLDPDELTIGDLEDFEDGVKMPLYEALKPVPVLDDDGNKVVDPETGRPEMTVKVSATALKHLVWIVKRAEQPDFTIEDARRVKVSALELVGDDDEEDGQGNDGDAATELPA